MASPFASSGIASNSSCSFPHILLQVFNALWMPSFEYDVPMLGVDLISLGKQRVLSVIDMQPLHPDEAYSKKYIQRSEISGIKAKYPDLHGKLSGKIYDDTSFFSSNMLFGRFTDETKLKPVHAVKCLQRQLLYYNHFCIM